MLKSINYQSFIKGKTAAGVEVMLSANGISAINLAVLSVHRSALRIDIFKTGLNDILLLKPFIPENVPVNLVISGKGVIHKIVSGQESIEEGALLQRCLPNANPEEFYMEHEPADVNNTQAVLVSVIRKKQAHEIIEEFGKNEIYVVSASLGPFCVKSIIPLLSRSPQPEKYELVLHGRKLIYHKGKIGDFVMPPEGENRAVLNAENILVGDESIDSQCAVPFAAAFQYLFEGGSRSVTRVPHIIIAQGEREGKKLFSALGKGLLLFFLSILFINFILFTHYSSRYSELEARVNSGRDQLTRYENLKKTLDEKRTFLKSAGFFEQSKLSFYADRIISGLPERIRLSEMKLNRPVKTPGTEKEIAFSMKNISIKGVCNETTMLNEWMKFIQQQEWIKDVTIENYSKSKSDSPAEFQLEITLK